MRLLDKLERRFGRFAVPNVTMGLIVLQIVTYALSLAKPDYFAGVLVLDPQKVLEGDYWRVLTFLVTPPATNPIFAFFFWYLFLMMGTALEQFWGTFRYNIFLLVGYAATIAAAFAVLGLFGEGGAISNVYFHSTVFLAFAYLYPTFELAIFFIFPIQVKWLALLTWVTYIFILIFHGWADRLPLLASLLNFFLFFGVDIVRRMRGSHRRMTAQSKRLARRDEPRHRCTVCGITDRSHREMEFRYCSKCDGAHAYCTEHLANHEHVVKDKSGEPSSAAK